MSFQYWIFLTFIILTTSLNAKPLNITVDTDINHGNWYPLSKIEMKAAAVDSALSELTQNGRFKIRHATDLPENSDGHLQFSISLIGSAGVVKLTSTLDLKEKATYISTVSMNIKGLEYQGIYDAFEYVGEEGAKRLNTKIHMIKNEKGKFQSEIKPIIKDESNAAMLFDQAQQLKRKGLYHKSRVLFETVVEESVTPKWRRLALDEIRYGLPIFEADNMMLDNAFQDPVAVMTKMEKVSHLYRQILADNTDDAKRVMDMNRRLDQMSISVKHMKNAIKANSISRAYQLRPALLEFFMSRGEWPDKRTLKSMLKGMGYVVIRYDSNHNSLDLVMKDTKYNTEMQISGNLNNLSIKAK